MYQISQGHYALTVLWNLSHDGSEWRVCPKTCKNEEYIGAIVWWAGCKTSTGLTFFGSRQHKLSGVKLWIDGKKRRLSHFYVNNGEQDPTSIFMLYQHYAGEPSLIKLRVFFPPLGKIIIIPYTTVSYYYAIQKAPCVAFGKKLFWQLCRRILNVHPVLTHTSFYIKYGCWHCSLCRAFF